MKLFKRLLIAPAALGLLSPLAANASEVNLNEVSNYSSEEFEMNSNTFINSSPVSTLLAGGEGMVDDHDGGFSETTTAAFSADFAVGAEDGAGAFRVMVHGGAWVDSDLQTAIRDLGATVGANNYDASGATVAAFTF